MNRNGGLKLRWVLVQCLFWTNKHPFLYMPAYRHHCIEAIRWAPLLKNYGMVPNLVYKVLSYVGWWLKWHPNPNKTLGFHSPPCDNKKTRYPLPMTYFLVFYFLFEILEAHIIGSLKALAIGSLKTQFNKEWKLISK